jgi:CheY-like chemotaxis protein
MAQPIVKKLEQGDLPISSCRVGCHSRLDDIMKSPAILVVEPHSDTRLMYRLSLAEFAGDVEEAQDGAQALAKALTRPPDVVISELRMPRVDGFALCSLLRSDEQTKETAIIIVTGNCATEVMHTVEARGADVVLVKPCSPVTLASTVRMLLLRHERPASLSAAAVPPDGRPTARAMSRACTRGMTTTPPTPPPQLHCPHCDGTLQYQHTQLGGVNDHFAERWDYFVCGRCGTFQYRHRTRKLRAVDHQRTA